MLSAVRSWTRQGRLEQGTMAVREPRLPILLACVF